MLHGAITHIPTFFFFILLISFFSSSTSKRLTLQENAVDDDCSTGNPIDDCWRCDAGWESNRKALADCAFGFGRNAGGGKEGDIDVVFNSSDDQMSPSNGTLRHALVQPDHLWVVFAHDMTVRLRVELILTSHKTIDGRGADVTITGGGCITVQSITNVIIHNIRVAGCRPSGNQWVRSSTSHAGVRGMSDGDGISIFNATDVWVDHCSLEDCADGLLDAVEGTTNLTVSNCRFSRHDKVMLLGHQDDYRRDGRSMVTVAFNVFGEELVQRMPRCRFGYFHVVNNDYTGWEMYAIGGSAHATITSQGNRFLASNPQALQVTDYMDKDGEWPWNWTSENDWLLNGAYFTNSGVSTHTYESFYDMEVRDPRAVERVTMNAGVLSCGGDGVCSRNMTGGGQGWWRKPVDMTNAVGTMLAVVLIVFFVVVVVLVKTKDQWSFGKNGKR